MLICERCYPVWCLADMVNLFTISVFALQPAFFILGYHSNLHHQIPDTCFTQPVVFLNKLRVFVLQGDKSVMQIELRFF
jgi:hypothetical protein